MVIKNYLKGYAYLLGIIIGLTLLFSVFNYFFKIPIDALKIATAIIAILGASFIMGKGLKEKGYIEGIKFSLGYLLMVTIIKLIIGSAFNLKVFIIYGVILLGGTLGAMIGINFKKS